MSDNTAVTTTNEKVAAFVEKKLRKNANYDRDQLKAEAEEIDPGIKDLSKTQFHARYSLQAMRRINKANGDATPTAAAETTETATPQKRGRKPRAATPVATASTRQAPAPTNGSREQIDPKVMVVRDLLFNFQRENKPDRGNFYRYWDKLTEISQRVVETAGK